VELVWQNNRYIWRDGGALAGGVRRISAKGKRAAVQRLMRGESVETIFRDLNGPVHRRAAWRDKVLMGAESGLKARERYARDDEIVQRAGPRLGILRPVLSGRFGEGRAIMRSAVVRKERALQSARLTS